MKYIILSIIVTIVFACQKDKEHLLCCTAPMSFSAIVEQTGNTSCGKPQIFVEDTSTLNYYPALIGQRFVLDQLPDSLRVMNKKVQLVVSFVEDDKEFACLAIGTSYPHLQFITGRTAP